MDVVEEDEAVLVGVDEFARVDRLKLGEGEGSHEGVAARDVAGSARAPTHLVVPVRVDTVAGVEVPVRSGLPPQSEPRRILFLLSAHGDTSGRKKTYVDIYLRCSIIQPVQ